MAYRLDDAVTHRLNGILDSIADLIFHFALDLSLSIIREAIDSEIFSVRDKAIGQAHRVATYNGFRGRVVRCVKCCA